MWKVYYPLHESLITIDQHTIHTYLQEYSESEESHEKTVWVIVPGFGEPYIDEKIQWLYSNIRQIRKTMDETWKLFVFIAQYSDSATPYLQRLPKFENTWWWIHHEEGFIGQFLYKYMKPECLHKSVHAIIMLLDDVSLDPNINVSRLIHLMEWEDVDIISPSLSRKSASCHRFMYRTWDSKPNILRRTNYAELFMYVFSPKGYIKWHGLLQPWTTFLWGIDMVLYPHKIRIAIHDGMSVRHHLSSKLEKSPFYRDMQEELKKFSKLHPDNIAFKFTNLFVTDKSGVVYVGKDINPKSQALNR